MIHLPSGLVLGLLPQPCPQEKRSGHVKAAVANGQGARKRRRVEDPEADGAAGSAYTHPRDMNSKQRRKLKLMAKTRRREERDKEQPPSKSQLKTRKNRKIAKDRKAAERDSAISRKLLSHKLKRAKGERAAVL